MHDQQKPVFNPEPMVNKLSAMFRNTTKPLGFTNPTLKKLQVCFTYFVDEIQRGPSYDASKMSVFVLHWIQKIESALSSQTRDQELVELAKVQYTHQNFYV